MDIQGVLNKVEEVTQPIFENLGYELIEREFVQEGGRMVLRLYIDGEGGVNIDDCERASRAVEDVLEVEEAVPFPYNLEVSSPGLNRPLRKRKDFERFKGSQVRLKTSEPIDGRMNFKGELKGMEADNILMMIDGVEFRIPMAKLAKARIELRETKL